MKLKVNVLLATQYMFCGNVHIKCVDETNNGFIVGDLKIPDYGETHKAERMAAVNAIVKALSDLEVK